MKTESINHRPAPSLPHTTPRPAEAGILSNGTLSNGTLSDAEIRQIVREVLG